MEQFPGDANSKKKEQPTRRSFLKMIGVASVAALASNIGLSETAEARNVPTGAEARKVPVEPSRERIVPENQEFSIEQWESYKKIILESKIKDNIQYIESKLGQAAAPFLFKVKEDMFLFDQLLEDEKKGVDLSQGDNRGLVIQALRDFHLFYDSATYEKIGRISMEEVRHNPPEFIGFEHLPKDGNQGIKEVLETRLDAAWLYGNISSFRFSRSVQKAKTFQIAGEALSDRLNGIFYRSFRESIVIYDTPYLKDPRELRSVINHEIAHHNDWQNSNVLTMQERMQFFRDVLERLESPEHIVFPYIENDIPKEYKDLTKEEIKLIQAEEYWAEINGLASVELLYGKQARDMELIAKWRRLIIERYPIL